MKLKLFNFSLFFVIAIVAANPSLAATKKYITDEFEVTMRSGTSTSNEILRMLKSGEAVTILEEDINTSYSLVEVDDGKKGYVLNRYLVDLPSAKFRLEQLQLKSAEQLDANALLQSEINNVQSVLEAEQVDNKNLEAALLATRNELSRVRDAAENTLSIVDKNEELKVIVEDLTQSNSGLGAENSALKDSSNMDWFIRGAGVSLIAFIVGILSPGFDGVNRIPGVLTE
jgi:SH3 domain protein